MLDEETGGDKASKASMRRSWNNRQNWPTGFRTYVASLYMTERDTWEKVADFVERARAAAAGSDH